MQVLDSAMNVRDIVLPVLGEKKLILYSKYKYFISIIDVGLEDYSSTLYKLIQ